VFRRHRRCNNYKKLLLGEVGLSKTLDTFKMVLWSQAGKKTIPRGDAGPAYQSLKLMPYNHFYCSEEKRLSHKTSLQVRRDQRIRAKARNFYGSNSYRGRATRRQRDDRSKTILVRPGPWVRESREEDGEHAQPDLGSATARHIQRNGRENYLEFLCPPRKKDHESRELREGIKELGDKEEAGKSVGYESTVMRETSTGAVPQA